MWRIIHSPWIKQTFGLGKHSITRAIKLAIYSIILGALTGKLTWEWCVYEGLCKTAEKIQPKLMQLTTNQKNEDEMKIQAEALYKTLISYR